MPDTRGNMNQADLEKIIQARLGVVTAAQVRERYVMRNLLDLPKTYQDAMPVTADEKQLAAAEYLIRQNYRKDMQEHAPKFLPPSIGAKAQPAAADVTPPPNVAAMTPNEALMYGLKLSRQRAQRRRGG